MARASTVAEPAEDIPAPPTAPPVIKCCGTCQGWRSLNAMPSMGQCMPSGKAGVSPQITQDWSGCSSWHPAQ